jgi:hypothetical protein
VARASLREGRRGTLLNEAEVTAIFEVLADLNVRLREIHEVLKEEFGGEEEVEEEDGP